MIMPRLQDENNRYLTAFEEGMVSAVIILYDKEEISRADVRRYLLMFNMSNDSIDYWLNWFGVADTSTKVLRQVKVYKDGQLIANFPTSDRGIISNSNASVPDYIQNYISVNLVRGLNNGEIYEWSWEVEASEGS